MVYQFMMRVLALILTAVIIGGCGGKTELKPEGSDSVGNTLQQGGTVTEEAVKANNNSNAEITEKHDINGTGRDPVIQSSSQDMEENSNEEANTGDAVMLENESLAGSDSTGTDYDEAETDVNGDAEGYAIENNQKPDLEDEYEDHLDMEIHTNPFSSDSELVFSLFMAFQEAGRNLGYITQDNNPELTFDVSTQTVKNCYFYMDCYADFTKEETVESIEGYTDELVYILNNSYPELHFEFVAIFWKIPAIDEESKYAASYYCEEKDGKLERGDGSGLIYN